MVSFDGAGGMDYEEERDAGVLGPDGFMRAEREGFSARRLEVVTPSLTAVSHASIASGALPSETGIVSNSFLPRGAKILTRVSGFDAESETEMIWEAAARQGRRVASLAWPGVSQRTPRTSVPVMLSWTEPSAPSFLWQGPSAESPLLEPDFALPVEARTFSPPRAFRVPRAEKPGLVSPAEPPFLFVAVDGSDDGRRNYDRLLVVGPGGELRAAARPGDWFSLSFTMNQWEGEKQVLFGRWCRLLALAQDLSTISIYVGGLGRNAASPEDFRRTIDRRAGFWPGPPDPLLLESGGFDTQSFVQQADRLTQHLGEVFRVADRRGDWDLLLGYQPVIDESLHVFLINDPRQPWFTPERSEKARSAMREIWRAADRAAAAYLRFRNRGDVLFVSDHGTRVMTRSVYLAELLRRQGWIVTKPSPTGGLTITPESPVDVATSGGIGNIYLNLAGRNPGGVVSPEKAPEMVQTIAQYLRSLKFDDGEPVFRTVIPTSEAGPLGLKHANSGDLIAITAGSAALRAGFPSRPGDGPFGPAEIPGQHGFDPDPRLDGIFFHVGESIQPARIEAFRATAVAARLSERLGFDPPRRKVQP